MRTLLVELDNEELPEMWNATFFVLDQKYLDYKNSTVRFNELPPRTHYGHFAELDDASCSVEGHHPKFYGKLPSLSVNIEHADINVEEGEGSYEGYSMTKSQITCELRWLISLKTKGCTIHRGVKPKLALRDMPTKKCWTT